MKRKNNEDDVYSNANNLPTDTTDEASKIEDLESEGMTEKNTIDNT